MGSMMQAYVVLHLTLLLAAWGVHGLDVAQEALLQRHCAGPGEPRQDTRDVRIPVSFINGDWVDNSNQEISFLPFADAGFSQSPEQLSSFWVTNVTRRRRNVGKLDVTGILALAVTTTRDLAATTNPAQESRFFQSYPGFSLLNIAVDGHYMETDTEGLLCMLGCTVNIPEFAWLTPGGNESLSNSSGTVFVWNNENKDCDYVLKLRYPWRISLATPAIRGHLSSFRRSSLDIKLSSGWKTELPYNFDAGELVAGACNQTFLNQTVADKEVYRGPSLCPILSELVHEWGGFSVKLNWPCLDSHAFCSQLGPFRNARDYKEITDARLFLRNLRCSNGTSQWLNDNTLSGPAATQVSAVIRLQGKFEDGYFAYVKTGCNNGLTLNAEGTWDENGGVLCMAACRGNENDLDLKLSQREDCDVRVCMYIPLALTILQRGILVGNISSTRSYDAHDAHTVTRYFYPLSFFLPFNAQERPPDYIKDLHYQYTKMDLAHDIWTQNEQSSSNRNRFLPKISSALLTYPSLETTNADYNLLRADLIIQSSGESSDNSDFPVEFDFVAMDHMLFRGWAEPMMESPFETDSDKTKKLDHVQVAGKLKLGTKVDINTEGLYDPKNGKMYMVGCRQVKEEWAVLSAINDLDEGLDCFLEVVMQYPAVSLIRIEQSVKISITSTRPHNDSIYFSPLTVSTARVVYESQSRGVITEKHLEGLLSIITLTFMVLCLLGQGWHMKQHPDSVAFVSLLMVGIQAVSFATTLITGVETLFAADKNPLLGTFPEEGFRPVSYLVKVLSLIALLVLIRLFERVWSARTRASSSLSDVHRAPHEKKVFILWAIFHIVGLTIVLISHSRSQAFDLAASDDLPFQQQSNPTTEEEELTRSTTLAHPGGRDWQKELVEYGGLVQDLFLLPQVFGGLFWEISGKPLRRLYYVGITALRLFPHIYDRYRKSHFFPYVNNGDYVYANPNYDFFSRAGDIVIPVLSLVLAVAIWFQQSCRTVQLGRSFFRSSKYTALPSESELVDRTPIAHSPTAGKVDEA